MSQTIWIVLLIATAVLAGGVGWALSGARAVARERASIREALRRLGEGGGRPEAGSVAEEALTAGWIQRPGPSVDEVRRAAVGRMIAFLRGAVAGPLQRALTDANEATRPDLEEAVGALQDLEFHALEHDAEPVRSDLVRLAREVAHEFASDASVAVKEILPAGAVHVAADPQAFKDAVYLVLHNAAEFGGGTTVSIQVMAEGGAPGLIVRDRGKGFSPEAFRRAMDPFFSTSESGLGLGLARARQLIEGMGGEIDLRNHPEGGAEVAIRLRAG